MEVGVKQSVEREATGLHSIRKSWSKPCITGLSMKNTASADSPFDLELEFDFGTFGGCPNPPECENFFSF